MATSFAASFHGSPGNATTAFKWIAGRTWLVNNLVYPLTVPNGLYYKCTTGGIGGGSEPTWPLVAGGTVTDGAAVFTCQGDFPIGEAQVRLATEPSDGDAENAASVNLAFNGGGDWIDFLRLALFSENVLGNSRFDFWNRTGPAFGTTVTTAGAVGQHVFLADRWYTNCNNAAGSVDVTRIGLAQSSDLPAQTNNAIRVQRTAGNASGADINLIQEIDPSLIETLISPFGAGVQITTYVLSFFAKFGANFSGAQLNVLAQFGTDSPPVSIVTGYANSVIGLSNQVVKPALGGTYVKYRMSFNAPGNLSGGSPILEGSLKISFTPTGTAGANDWFEITKVMLTAGTCDVWKQAGGGPEGDSILCERFYENSWNRNGPVGGASTFPLLIIPTVSAGVGSGSAMPMSEIRFRTPKFTSFPATLNTYNGAGTVGHVTLPVVGSIAITALPQDTKVGLYINGTGGTYTILDAGVASGSWEMDCEIIA